MIKHLAHNGQALGEVVPNGLTYGIYLGRIGFVGYELDRSHYLATKDNCEAYATDYLLYRNGKGLDGGLHTEVEIDDLESDALKVAGKSWLQYLDQRFLPFDPAYPGSGEYYQTSRDVGLVVNDLLTLTLAEPDSLDITHNLGSVGQEISFLINVGDTESIYQKFVTLSKMKPGFDFEITWDKVFNMYYPKKSALQSFTLESGKNIEAFNYINSGPKGTHLLATGSTLSSQIGTIVENASARGKYRRLDVAEDFGDIFDATGLDILAQADIDRQILPFGKFSCRYVGEDDLFDLVGLGDYVRIKVDFEWDNIDADYRLIGIEGDAGNEGDETLTLVFDDGTISL